MVHRPLDRQAPTVEPADAVLDGKLIPRPVHGLAPRPAWTAPLVKPAFIRDPAQTARAMLRAGVRVPVRFPTAVLRGSGRALVAWWRWVQAEEELATLLRTGTITPKDLKEIAELRKARRTSTIYTLGSSGAGGLILHATQGVGATLLAGFAGVLGLAAAGRRTDPAAALPGLPAVGSAEPSPDVAVTNEVLTDAFVAAGIIKAGQVVKLVSLPHHDGKALTVVAELPKGKTGAQVGETKAHAALASAFGVDVAQLDVERVKGNARLVSLWLSDDDPYDRPARRSPLVDAEAWDLWQPVPIGVDKRGRIVYLPLVFTSVLVGSMPRMGKTVYLRALAMAAALDPSARLFIWDGKGGKDFAPFKDLCHGYGKGVRGDTVERLVFALRGLVADMNDRYERLEEFDDDVCPDSKVTPEMTADPSLGMGFTVVILDEVQRYLEDPVWGEEITEALTDLAKVGPALGFVIILATQKPDAETIPDSLRGQLGTRIALRTMTYQASETILGTGTSKAGHNAADFALHHKGWALLRGAEDIDLGADVVTLHGYFANVPDARQVAARAAALRQAAGTLPGKVSAGRPDGRERIPALLADIADLADADAGPRLSTTGIIDKLGLDMSAKALGAQLARWGCPVDRQQINGREVRGPATADIRAAVHRITHGGPVETIRSA
ncbi:FtsK/SpoIIIE domain-containing protein [Nonomuraea sp. NPDC001684]